MPAFTFNVALGREVELYNRIDSNDPTNSAFIMLVLAQSGLEANSVLKTYDTVADILAASNNEVTNTGYSRKTLTDSALSAYTVDDTDNSITLMLPSQTFATISAGDAWRKVIIAYDNDTTGGTDANLIPVVCGDLLILGVAVTPVGSNIVIDYSAGFVTCR